MKFHFLAKQAPKLGVKGLETSEYKPVRNINNSILQTNKKFTNILAIQINRLNGPVLYPRVRRSCGDTLRRRLAPYALELKNVLPPNPDRRDVAG